MKEKLIKWIQRPLWILACVSLFFLSACGQENLYQDLSERDANEILVVLYKQGVDAKKVRVEAAQEVSYVVQVPKEDIQRAQQILIANNLPRKKELGFSGICQEKSMIPTPEEEKCRKLLALKGEIINSLEKLDQVVDADVVLNIPEVDTFAGEEQEQKQPTASAVIRLKSEGEGQGTEALRESHLQRFISNSVEGLDPRNVAVLLSYAEPVEQILSKGPQAAATGGATSSSSSPSKESSKEAVTASTAPLSTIVGLQIHPESVQRFKIYAVAMLGLLILVSGVLILNVFKLTRLKQQLKVSAGAIVVEPEAPAALPEGGANPAQLPAAEAETSEQNIESNEEQQS